jgi:hypothetical protein
MLTDSLNRDAESVINQLSSAVRDLELAMEREALTRRAFANAKQDYADSEAEIQFELVHTADGKNAEQRKAQVDVGLIRARNEGALRKEWARMLAAQTEADDAKLALDQATRRYRAVEAVAELTTAMLRSLSR